MEQNETKLGMNPSNSEYDKDGNILKTGTCRFCGQAHMMPFLNDVSQEVVDEEATRTCKCPLATHHKAYETNREQAFKKIDKLMKAYPVGAEILRKFIEDNYLFEDSPSGTQPIFTRAMFQINNITVKISVDKDINIKIKKRCVTEEE